MAGWKRGGREGERERERERGRERLMVGRKRVKLDAHLLYSGNDVLSVFQLNCLF